MAAGMAAACGQFTLVHTLFLFSPNLFQSVRALRGYFDPF